MSVYSQKNIIYLLTATRWRRRNLRFYSMKFITFNETRIRTLQKEIVVPRISLEVNEKNN
jgi:hypothetical protein